MENYATLDQLERLSKLMDRIVSQMEINQVRENALASELIKQREEISELRQLLKELQDK